MSPTDWSWSGEALAPVLLAAGYLAATRGAREGWRAASFLGGCGLLVVALVTPLDTLGRPVERWRVVSFGASLAWIAVVSITPLQTVALNYLLSAHLLQNVVFAEWAPALFVLGIPPFLAASIARLPLARYVTSKAVASA